MSPKLVACLGAARRASLQQWPISCPVIDHFDGRAVRPPLPAEVLSFIDSGARSKMGWPHSER